MYLHRSLLTFLLLTPLAMAERIDIDEDTTFPDGTVVPAGDTWRIKDGAVVTILGSFRVEGSLRVIQSSAINGNVTCAPGGYINIQNSDMIGQFLAEPGCDEIRLFADAVLQGDITGGPVRWVSIRMRTTVQGRLHLKIGAKLDIDHSTVDGNVRAHFVPHEHTNGFDLDTATVTRGVKITSEPDVMPNYSIRDSTVGTRGIFNGADNARIRRTQFGNRLRVAASDYAQVKECTQLNPLGAIAVVNNTHSRVSDNVIQGDLRFRKGRQENASCEAENNTVFGSIIGSCQ
ncbi:hypothetical protein [Ferrimonas marina]|uniref:Right handed beta helix region n=1 Tax=Ferrimonas marina TaxID=299255 RepID=A0A1M5U1N3_9GAMM|nr:hypothetical protein [Ferrimonas marina]SHH56780.1 hypothetical protein SAMN02745129_2365 [Ferrimonas marina]